MTRMIKEDVYPSVAEMMRTNLASVAWRTAKIGLHSV